jgi:signal transduction histidine kinase
VTITKRSFRFWLIYSLAWLPYAASYVAVFVSHLNASYLTAVKDALFNIIPAALLGAGVVASCRRIHRPRDWRLSLVVHSILALLYAGLWISAVPLLFAVEEEIKHRHWSYQPFVGYAFQWQFFAGLMIYATIAGIVYALDTGERFRAEEARATRAESLRTRAELEALRAQLNPHFLFNTLHTLMALVRNDPPAAEEALEKLASLLRHVLTKKGEDSQDVALCDELQFIDSYLALEQLRLGDRLRVESRIQPDTLDCALPPFTLQPLVENTIKHAISTRPQGGVLLIRSELDDKVLRLEIVDDGPGATSEQVAAAKGLGLKIARQRFQTRYGDRAKFVVHTQPGMGFSVRLEIPLDCPVESRREVSN